MGQSVMRAVEESPSLSSEAFNRRHICIVTETYPPEINGVALTLAHLIEGLRAQDYPVSLVRPRQRSFDASPGDRDPQVALVHSLPLPGYRALHIGLPAGGALRRCWQEQRPDVVYVDTQGPLAWSALRAARRLGIPIFSGFHTNFDNYAKHYHAGWLRLFILSYLRSFHNRTDGTIVPSADLGDRVRELGLKNLSVLGRGVDSRRFAPERRSADLRRAWRAGRNDPVALYVGRIAAEKNLDLAVDAYRAMQRINNGVKFVLVGDGPLLAAAGSPWSLGLGAAMIAAGQALNLAVFYRLGKIGVFYGNKFGHKIPWSRKFPFSRLKHPQYLGALLSVWGFFLLMRFPHEDWYLLPVLETAYYSLGAYLER